MLERMETVIVAVAGVILFLVMIVFLPFALVFMLILETVIKALDMILSRIGSDSYDKEQWKDTEG